MRLDENELPRRHLPVVPGDGGESRRNGPDVRLHGIDISEQMLRRARERAERTGCGVSLNTADVEDLPYGDSTFDTVTATCVFCSVADPVRGLQEVGRVVKPGGRVLLLEHVRPQNPVLGKLFDLLTPFTRRLLGPEINRRTEENVQAAGLEFVSVRRNGIWREIEARSTQ